MRHSVATLRQPLQKKSLSALLDQLIAQFKQSTNIAIKSNINLVSPIPTEITTVIYRVIQEALTNIAKHSQATRVNLDLEVNEKIYLTIRDNGCGFNRVNNTTGFGLQGMQERVKAVNGTISINSQPQQGCKIAVEIPRLADT